MEITRYFHETQEGFTIYVVEQRFVIGQGYEYFKSFIGKDNLIIDDSALEIRIKKILSWTQKHIPNVGELIKTCFSASGSFSPVSVIDIITALSKVFAVEKHQAVGPEIMDPLIIQEGKVSKKNLAQMVSLHQESILQPAIIILLKDNDFERAKQLVSKCPNGINVKMIRNSGESEIYKVINTGAEDYEDFIDSYAKQCYSTCSETKRDILFSEEWKENSIIHDYTPHIFRFRSLLIEENKSENTLSEISHTIDDLIKIQTFTDSEEKVKQSLLCMLKLFKVYCLDRCTTDMNEAMDIADFLDNDILKAHVLRYSNFFPNLSILERNDMLKNAATIFEKNNIIDHHIYCTNNYLINQFYTDNIELKSFCKLQESAVYNVPGLVGMSYIYNNVGVAHLYSMQYDEAINFFLKGLDYSKYRPVQRLGLMTNLLIAKSCNFLEINQNEIVRLFSYAFDTFGCERTPFLTANYIINGLLVAAKKDVTFAKQLIEKYPVENLLQIALSCGQFGTGSLTMQLGLLKYKYPSLIKHKFKYPHKTTSLSGIRKRFIENHLYNPTIFNAWL